MGLRKASKFTYIVNGVLTQLNCMYCFNLFDKVPCFVSNDVDNFLVIHSDEGIFVVLNKRYINGVDDIDTKIMIWHSILKIFFGKKVDGKKLTALCDINTAYSFGFSNTINVLRTNGKGNNSSIESRISLLEKLVANPNNKIPVYEMDTVLNHIALADIS